MRASYENLNLILRGLIAIIVGLSLFVFQEWVIIFFTQVIVAFLYINGGAKFVQVVMWQRSNRRLTEIMMQLFVASAHLMVASWLLLEQDFTTVFLVKSIGYYQILMALINLFSFSLMVKDDAGNRVDVLIRALIHLGFGLSSLILPTAINSTLNRVGCYFILLGLASIMDGRELSDKATYRSGRRRRWRITAPIWFTLLLPDSTIQKFNQYFTNKELDAQQFVQQNREVYVNYDPLALEVFIHVGKEGFNRVGHVDISYQDKVYSYGNHDIESRQLFDLIGDGVLFVVDKQKYIEYCMQEGSTVMVYGIHLSNLQKIALEAELAAIKKDTMVWHLTTDAQRHDYIGRMQLATQAQLYKFKRGKFKTYFVMGTNCVLLADQVIGTSGMDILALNGILTPGSYLAYFERESMKKGSFISAKFVINEGIYQEKHIANQ